MKSAQLCILMLAMAMAGWAQAQCRQSCLNRAPDGRCLHVVEDCRTAHRSMHESRQEPRYEGGANCDWGSSDGRCRRSGPPPGASGQCVFNPATGGRQTCYHMSADGRCLHFGERCN